MYEKDILGWAVVKRTTHLKSRNTFCKQREVWWAKVGHNVGGEVDGKGESYSRPVVVIRSFGIASFLAIPLTTQGRSSNYYRVPVNVPRAASSNYALVNQIRVMDTKRLIRKIGMISVEDAETLRRAVRSLVE